jgi:SAM-dependent methyltransferase
MFTKFDPLAEKFLQDIEAKPQNVFFEVGGAYGNVAQAALEKGANNYYLNDCDARHLKAFARQLKDAGKSSLFSSLHLIEGRCPDDVTLSENSCDAILVNKVLHFFAPETVDAFVLWLKNGLKPGGKVYVLVASPLHKEFKELLPFYEKQKNEGKRFPGYWPKFNEQKEPQKKYNADTSPQLSIYGAEYATKALY